MNAAVPFFEALAHHALGAAVLALVAFAAGRVVRHAAVVHALWVMVLLKLLVPPVYELAVLPAPAAETVPELATLDARTVLALEAPATLLAVEAATPVPGWRPRAAAAALGVAALGSAALLVLAVVRLRRFRRLLGDAAEPPPELTERVGVLARRLGLGRAPRTRVVDARLSPMLWPRPAGALLILPAALLERLTASELDAVLVHELAHLKRRDHWVRFLELAATVAFWWHPVVWWARRNLRRVEERSCDAWVGHVLPGRARAYAHGLLKTLEFLAGPRRPLPAVATGIDNRNDLEERLTMILTERTPKILTSWHRFILASLAAALLVVIPTRAERAEEPSPEEERFEAQRLDLERRELELESQLQDLNAQRMRLERERQELKHQAALEHFDQRLNELEAAGETAEAELVRARREALVKEAELARERYEVEQRMIAELMPQERELRARRLRQEELELAGRHEEAEALAAELRQAEERMATLAAEQQQAHLEIEQKHLALRQQQLEERQRILAESGRAEEAALVAAERERFELEREMMDLERDRLHEHAERLVLAAEGARESAEVEALHRVKEFELQERRAALEKAMVEKALQAKLAALEARRGEVSEAEQAEIDAILAKLEAELEHLHEKREEPEEQP